MPNTKTNNPDTSVDEFQLTVAEQLGSINKHLEVMEKQHQDSAVNAEKRRAEFQETMKGLDDRLRDLEIRSAKNGGLAGLVSGVGVTLIAEWFRRTFGG